MSLNRCRIISRALLLLALVLAGSVEAAPTFSLTGVNTRTPVGWPRRPSIIVIQCDSLGYLDLSCYGQQKFTTPNLDRLATEGMMFTNYDALGADGPTVRAALLLGRDPGRVNTWLTPDDVLVAQLLKQAGYYTGLIGEWDFGGADSGNAPWQKGFDEFAGYFTPVDAENYYADFMWRHAPKSIYNTTNHQFETYIGKETLIPNANGAEGKYIPDLYARAVTGFLNNYHPDQANRYRPFFLWLSYPTPRPNQAEALRTGNGLQVPTDAPFSEEAWPQPEKNKAAMITRLDADIGHLLDDLKSQGMSNNVAVFFTSATVARKTGGVDPLFFPSVVSTNDVRLPMIAWWPQHIPAGRVSGYHWSPSDFLPTAAAIAMTGCPTNVDGTPIVSALYGRVLTNAPANP